MPLTLLTGPANSAKAGAILAAYRARLARQPILVVPTTGDLAHYRRELAAEGVTFGARVETFAGLIDEIAARCEYRARRVGEHVRERLVALAIAGARLRTLAEAAQSPGFVGAAAAFVAELERALIEPQRLRGALAAWAGADAGRRALARELSAIYGGYQAALGRLGVLDAELFAWRALDTLRTNPGRWGTAPVLFYGFDDLTPLELDAVETLARIVATDVVFALHYEAGRVAFAGRAATFERLRPLAEQHERLPARAEHYAPRARAALHHLERGLFEQGAGTDGLADLRLWDEPRARPSANGAIRLLESGGERAEIELVGAELLELLAEGIQPAQIAVVFRSPARHAPLVAQVFGALGIPHAVPQEVMLAQTALGRGLLGLLRCAQSADAAADELLAYLRVPGIVEDSAALDELEAGLRRAGARSARAVRRAWERKQPALAELDALRNACRAGGSAALEELRARLQAMFAAPRRGCAATLTSDERIDAAVVAQACRALDELIALGVGEPRALPRGEDLLGWLAGLRIVQAPPADARGVLIADPLAIRARRFRVVVLCGLQEGEFPCPASPEPFLPAERRRELALASGLVLAAHDDPLPDERFLFYACASRPTDRLYLSWRSSDEEGNPSAPSFFVEDVRELFDERLWATRRQRPLAQVTWAPEQAPTAAERARALAARGPRRAAPPLGPLRSPAGLAALARRPPLSPGALEAFADCPIRWLVERVLRPRALRPDDEPLTRGALAHRLLHDTLTQLRERTGSARIQRGTLAEAELILDEAIEREVAAQRSPSAPAADAALRRLRADLRRFLRREAERDDGLEPQRLELDFGFDDGELPALELGDGRVRVRGRIDRVDVDRVGGGAVVRDYKSTRAEPVARWQRDRRLQVALYMLAVERLLEIPVIGGAYQPVLVDRPARGLGLADTDGAGAGAGGGARGGANDAPGGIASLLPAEDLRDATSFREQLDIAERCACELAAALGSGRLEPTPQTCTPNGRGCAYPGICRSVDG